MRRGRSRSRSKRCRSWSWAKPSALFVATSALASASQSRAHVVARAVLLSVLGGHSPAPLGTRTWCVSEPLCGRRFPPEPRQPGRAHAVVWRTVRIWLRLSRAPSSQVPLGELRSVQDLVEDAKTRRSRRSASSGRRRRRGGVTLRLRHTRVPCAGHECDLSLAVGGPYVSDECRHHGSRPPRPQLLARAPRPVTLGLRARAPEEAHPPP
jgi:hypothetical protein